MSQVDNTDVLQRMTRVETNLDIWTASSLERSAPVRRPYKHSIQLSRYIIGWTRLRTIKNVSGALSLARYWPRRSVRLLNLMGMIAMKINWKQKLAILPDTDVSGIFLLTL